MNKHNKTLMRLEDLLPTLSKHRGWAEQLDLHSIFLNWHDLLDADVAEHCQPLKIVGKILWVEAENSAWLQQLQFQSAHLMDTFNDSLRISKLKGVRFCMMTEDRVAVKKQEQVLSYVQPSSKEIKDFEYQAAGISDKDAREALVRFWYLSQACRKE